MAEKAMAKSLAPLLILRILEEYSDEKHPLNQEQIASFLEENYEVDMERKAISKHLKNLDEMEDISIKRGSVRRSDGSTHVGVYLDERTFSDHELRIIIDSLSASPFISDWETQDMIRQVSGMSSRHFRKKIGHYRFMNDRGKTENTTLLYNLDIIDLAITEGKKIRFDLLSYDKDGNLKIAVCNQVTTPIQMLVKEQTYYLLCGCVSDSFRGGYALYSYALDTITNVEVLKDQKADDLTTIPAFAHGIDYNKLLREHPDLDNFIGKPELCVFHCHRHMLGKFKAHFGSEIRITPLERPSAMEGLADFRSCLFDHMLEVSVVTDPYAALNFAWKHPEGIWLISPEKANKEARRRIRAQQTYYSFLEDHCCTKEEAKKRRSENHRIDKKAMAEAQRKVIDPKG